MTTMEQRESYYDALALTLATGLTVAQAAVRHSYAQSAIYRLLMDPRFKALIHKHRAEINERAYGLAVSGLKTAIDTIAAIMTDEKADKKTRLQAARYWIEAHSTMRTAELQERMYSLEARLQKLETPSQIIDAEAETITTTEVAIVDGVRQ